MPTTVFILIDVIVRIIDIDVWLDQSHEHVCREARYAPHRYLGNRQY